MKPITYLGCFLVAVAVVLLNASSLPAQSQRDALQKPRLVITADPELDDVNTLIRVILYTTDFKVEDRAYGNLFLCASVHESAGGWQDFYLFLTISVDARTRSASQAYGRPSPRQQSNSLATSGRPAALNVIAT
jgi:hypothetical protein